MRAYVRIFTLCLLIAIVSVCAWAFYVEGWHRVGEVHIVLEEGADKSVLFDRIQSTLSQQYAQLSGRYIWQVGLRELLRIAEQDRRIQSVTVRREFPNRIQVQVVPHRPILGYLDQKGLIYPVAADASLLPPLSAREGLDWPLLRGGNFYSDKSLRERAIELIEDVPEAGRFGRSKISEITYVNKSGFNLFLLPNGAEVRMGENDFGRKASRVEQVLNYLDDQQMKSRVIDARFAKKVVVRLRNAP